MTRALIRFARMPWEGARHERALRAWDRAERALPAGARIERVPNMDNASHAEMFRRMYSGAEPCDLLILTEHDFLPDLTDDWIANVDRALGDHQALFVPYVTRDPDTWALEHYGCPGGWFMAFRREACPDALYFGGRDPGNELHRQIEDFAYLKHEDAPPSLRYPGIGTHLFWSRHWEDPPWSEPAGFPMSVVHFLIDRHLSRWETQGRV